MRVCGHRVRARIDQVELGGASAGAVPAADFAPCHPEVIQFNLRSDSQGGSGLLEVEH